MELDHGTVVHLVDVVARKHHDEVGVEPVDEADVLVNRIGRALEPTTFVAHMRVGRQHVSAAVIGIQIPRSTIADIAVQNERLILRQHTDDVDARIGAV